MSWKLIATAPRDVEITQPVQLGPRVRLRGADREATGRLRHPVTGYDIASDQVIERPAGWWDDVGRPLGFEPTEWAPIGA